MTMIPKPNKSCYICGSDNWWQFPDGGWNCGRCHPNLNPGPAPSPEEEESVPERIVISDQSVLSDKKAFSPETLALRDRVIQGNMKLNVALKQICQLDVESQEWKDQMEQWSQATAKLWILCDNLTGMGYTDCLYLDQDGKKTKKCLPTDDPYGCRVCSSAIPYWRQEWDEL